MITPVILCGGIGTRLWPRSRESLPKQFINLTDDSETLLQQTLLRVSKSEVFTAPIIISSSKHKSLLQENCRAVGVEPLAVLLEPFGKNTAPAIAVAAEWLEMNGKGNTVMLVLPADHRIMETQHFVATVKATQGAATAGKLMTFGINPSYPATGYGYIESGSPIAGHTDVYSVTHFIEKPDDERAKKFVSDKRYYWNSGMFMMKAEQYLTELKRFEPKIHKYAQAALKEGHTEDNYTLLDEMQFFLCPNQSIDYGIMERTDNAAVIPLNINWDDVGSWRAVYNLMPKDENGNSTSGDIVLHDTHNSFAYSEDGLVAMVGVENLVVINTKDAVMVVHKDQTEKVKQLVESLQVDKRKEFYYSTRVFRPWGFYEDLEQGPNFRVKRIQVKSQQKISLQFHRHRSEHWVVISGTATVTQGDRKYSLSVGESTYIKVGEHHRLENAHSTPLEIIEVQIGDYVGEDDIVRLDDIYGRVKPSLAEAV